MKIFNVSTRLPGFIILALSTLLLSGCVTKTNFLTSSTSPAARGYVKVKQDDNQNYGIQIHVDYLVEVSGDLTTWNSGPTHTVTVQDTETSLVVRDALPISGNSKRFIRLRIAER